MIKSHNKLYHSLLLLSRLEKEKMIKMSQQVRKQMEEQRDKQLKEFEREKKRKEKERFNKEFGKGN